MTPADALQDLLERIGASRGRALLVSEEELRDWPEAAVHAMKNAGLLAPASPASSAVCPGCEQQCFMPVHTSPSGNRNAQSFIVCDKRDDVSRVPVSGARLRQWSASLAAVAGVASRLLGMTNAVALNGQRCEVGVLKGRRHSSHVVLVADGVLNIHAGGHILAFTNFLTFEGESFRLDKQSIVRLVDSPIAGAGDKESARQRRERLAKLVRAERGKGNRAFLKTVAGEEGITVSRLKQILKEPPKKLPGTRRLPY